MALIVIEGLDGAGKSTQIKNLTKRFTKAGFQVESLHFPRVEVGSYGILIDKFLKGEFGKLSEVSPYLVASLYASDRLAAKPLLEEWLAQGKVVLLDRYVFSNIAYQCAKFSNKNEQEELRQWILKLEYGENNLPKPLVEIYVDAPKNFRQANLQSPDIQEADKIYQENVRQVYLNAAEKKELVILESQNDKGEMLQVEEITSKIVNILSSYEQVSKIK